MRRRVATWGWITAAAVSLGAGAVAAEPKPNSLRALEPAEWDAAKAAHLLRRAGFGGSPDDVDRLVKLGLDAAVAELIDYQKIPFDVPPPLLDPIVIEAESRTDLKLLSEADRQAYQQKRQMEERQGAEETRLWWIDRMARTPRPLEEKMTLFWHGHCTSGMREVKRCLFMKEQNELLRGRCLGSFRDLLIAISKDRAMLVYLDNNRNEKVTPNENYARELLELFTLGVGNYEEADIKAAARAFTGWGFNREGFVFRKASHDFGDKTFLGKKGDFDGDEIIDIILEQPKCAQFLARNLLEFFCRPKPDDALVRALAAEIRKHKYELEPVMRTLLKSEAFYSSPSRAALVKSPVELLVGTAHTLDVPLANLPAVERALTALGQQLMQPPNVKGWDGGPKWINTATVFNRYNFVSQLISGSEDGKRPKKDKDELNDEENEAPETTMSGEMRPLSRRTGGPQMAYDPLPALKQREIATAEQVVDFYTGYLLAAPLADEKRAALIEYLNGPKNDFSLGAKGAGDRVRRTLMLLCSTPEYQLN